MPPATHVDVDGQEMESKESLSAGKPPTKDQLAPKLPVVRAAPLSTAVHTVVEGHDTA